LKIACLEEIAYIKGYIDEGMLRKLAQPMAKSSYGRYLMTVLENDQNAAGDQDNGVTSAAE
jgi:glucose-1-phosphate thymidylyltransferase